MMQSLARVYSAELKGIDAKLIEAEADLNIGLRSFNIVGLADKVPVGQRKKHERCPTLWRYSSRAKPKDRKDARIPCSTSMYFYKESDRLNPKGQKRCSTRRSAAVRHIRNRS